jgi:hypothetical protein
MTNNAYNTPYLYDERKKKERKKSLTKRVS